MPKVTEQLFANFGKIPQTPIQALAFSSSTSKNFVVDEFLENPNTVGFLSSGNEGTQRQLNILGGSVHYDKDYS